MGGGACPTPSRSDLVGQFKIEQGPIKTELYVRPTGELIDFLLLKELLFII